MKKKPWKSSFKTVLRYFFNLNGVRKKETELYPDPVSSRTEDDLPPRTRGLLFNDIEKCTGCSLCVDICPTKCIRVVNEEGHNLSRNWVAVFDIDFASCTFCGFCVDVCEPKSLVHTKKYQAAVQDVSTLVTHFGRGHLTSEQKEKWLLRRQLGEDD